MNVSVETLAQTVASAVQGLPLSACAETGVDGGKAENLGLRWTPNLAKALQYSREAQGEERNGCQYTAAMKWRKAAEFFAPNWRGVEYCWCEWERIMRLPRRLAAPAFAVPTMARVI